MVLGLGHPSSNYQWGLELFERPPCVCVCVCIYIYIYNGCYLELDYGLHMTSFCKSIINHVMNGCSFLSWREIQIWHTQDFISGGNCCCTISIFCALPLTKIIFQGVTGVIVICNDLILHRWPTFMYVRIPVDRLAGWLVGWLVLTTYPGELYTGFSLYILSSSDSGFD